MKKPEFNLLYEPWIKVLEDTGDIKELSLLEVFEYAHKFIDLSGEVPTQDIALLRFLLAVLHTVVARVDPKGQTRRIESPMHALQCWKEYWDLNKLPMVPIKSYLTYYEDRFWLFDEKRPFYQVAEIDGKGTAYKASKLNGELSQSNNKLRIFPQRTGDAQENLSYAEAARGLLYVNAYDDTASKSTKRGLPSPGAGWLGKLGLVTALGNNLFETLLLNLVLLPDGANEMWGDPVPIWEKSEVKKAERTEIPLPNNLPELYTLQSRRLFLRRDQQNVAGYWLIGGDFFARENSFIEQMTFWRRAKGGEINPLRHDPSRQLWRDFAVLLGLADNSRPPGIVKWLSRLQTEGIIDHSSFRLRTTGVQYGSKDFFIDDIFEDSIKFHSALLTEYGEEWLVRIINEIDIADKMVWQIARLVKELALASGGEGKAQEVNAAKEQAYYRLDEPFRWWIEDIDPNRDIDNKDEKCLVWWETLQKIIREYGQELVNESGLSAFTGRRISSGKKGGERRYTAPEIYNRFLYYTSSREALLGGGS